MSGFGRPIELQERIKIIRMARDGAPYRDIAKVLGRPLGSIKTAISDAILAGKLEPRRERADRRTHSWAEYRAGYH